MKQMVSPTGPLLASLLLLVASGLPSAAGTGDGGADLEAVSAHLAATLQDALWSNGTLARAESSYLANPVGGGDVIGFQWLMADFMRLQRAEYRKILELSTRVMSGPGGFGRHRAILDALDRMVAFKKTTRRFLAIDPAVTTDLAPQFKRLKANLDQMHRRVGELEPLLRAAI